MGDYQNSDAEQKQEALKAIIKQLHAGVPVEKLRKTFARLIKDTSPEEIAAMENGLIEEGFPPEEVQRLCDVHVQVFEKALTRSGKGKKIPGHPVYSYLQENNEAKRIMKTASKLAKKLRKRNPKPADFEAFEQAFNDLKQIETHYVRKENQLFPALEARKFTGPTKVMWGKHDEIRGFIKQTEQLYQQKAWDQFYKQFKTMISAMKKMIFLEEKILFPTSLRKLTDLDWAQIKLGEPEIGYAWITPSDLWDANIAQNLGIQPVEAMPQPETVPQKASTIKLAEGELTVEQITLLLKSLPVDITFVDEHDQVCFYSANKDRIFPRSPGIIGRKVQNCHPPKSVHIVNQIVEKFKAKERDVAEFWLQTDGKFIHIRYFPVFDDSGNYKGVIEVSQEVSGIRSLEGERRILDWE